MSSLSGPSSSASSAAASGVNIMEAWLIKGLRLLHSQKQEDTVRLRKFYKEACENEAQVMRTTLAEALRETKEETGEKRSRIIIPSIIETADEMGAPQLSDHSDSGSSSGPATSKRPKVGFFNIFDPTVTTDLGSKFRSSSSSSIQSLSTTPVVSATAVVVCQGGDKATEAFDPITTASPEHPSAPSALEDVADLVADLVCFVCGRLSAQQTLEPDGVTMNANVQVECSRCSTLYHQMCHIPPLLGRAPNSKTWLCSKCTAVPATIPSSLSASSLLTTVESVSKQKDVPSRRKKPYLQSPSKLVRK